MPLDALTTFLLAVGLAMDSFSVSVCSGAVTCGPRLLVALKIGAVMGGFQALMPILGWLGGSALVGVVADYDHWIALGLLVLVGGQMIKEAFSNSDGPGILDATRWRPLLALGVATSIDALAVGVSLAFLDGSILLPVVVIGFVTFALSAVGVLIGARAGALFRERVPLLGGIILIGIGIRIVVEHLGGGASL